MLDVENLPEPMDITGKVVRESDFASHGGSYADIFVGYCDRDAGPRTKLAIKVIRTQIYKDFNRHKLPKVIEVYAPRRH